MKVDPNKLNQNKKMSKAFGIDPGEEVTPEIVRDAILACFKEAHYKDVHFTSGDEIDEDVAREYSEKIVKNAFEGVEADFENPDKDDLKRVIDYLADFAKQFRDQKTIQSNYKKILQLIDKLP